MLRLNHIIDKILSKQSDFTYADVYELIRKKKDEVGGLLTDEGAAYIVAAELGVDLSEERKLETKIWIKDLVPGANDVSITGRIILIYPIREFTRPDQRAGKVASLVIADKTGILTVVLWDDKANLVHEKSICQNQILKFLHGYVREGLDGRAELNIGLRGKVVLSPSDVNAEDYPEVKEFFKSVKDLHAGDRYINIIVGVTRVSPVSVFQRRGKACQVIRMRLVDNTGKIIGVFWNNKVDIVRNVSRGDCLQILGAVVKKGLQGELELHINRRSKVKVLDEPPEIIFPRVKLTKISDLKLGMHDLDVLARVISIGPVRKFRRPSGEIGKVGTLLVGDETGMVRLSIWDDQTNLIETVSPGDAILIEGAYTRAGLGETVNLNLGKWGTLTVKPTIPEADRLQSIQVQVTPIAHLKEGIDIVTVEGYMTGAPSVREVVTSSGQVVRVASFGLKEESGEIRVSVWRELVDLVKDLPERSKLRIVNAHTRKRPDGTIELSSGLFTKIEVLSKDAVPKLPRLIITRRRKGIADLKDGITVNICAKIAKLKTVLVYPACPKCWKKLIQHDDKWICNKCREETKPEYRMIANAVLRDSTGDIETFFGGKLAEKLLGITVTEAHKLVLQTEDKNILIENARKNLEDSEVEVKGSVKIDDFTGHLRLIVKEFRFS